MPRRDWSVADPAWWATCLAALVLGDAVRHLLPGDAADLTHYVAGVPLFGFIAIAGYWRWRLRARWRTAIGLAAVGAAAALAVGWLKGRLS